MSRRLSLRPRILATSASHTRFSVPAGSWTRVSLRETSTRHSTTVPIWCSQAVYDIAQQVRFVHDTGRQDPHVSGVPMNLMPRRMWDLWSNCVVPFWVVFADARSALFNDSQYVRPWFFAVSHPWLDGDKRRAVETPINNDEWPVPLSASGRE